MSFLAKWSQWAPVLERAIIADRQSIDDVRELVESGKAQFWYDITAAVVTEILQFPRKRVLHCWLAAGDYDGIRRIEARVIPWAKESGCDEMQIVGRMGWRRRLKDYTERAVVLTKEI